MKSFIALCLSLSMVACAGFSVEKHATADKTGYSVLYGEDRPVESVEHTYKTVEVYKNNFWSPSYKYVMLFECDATGANCNQLGNAPVITPGILPATVGALAMPAAVIGAGALVGSGIRDSKSTTTTTNTNSNTSAGGTSGGGCQGNCGGGNNGNGN